MIQLTLFDRGRPRLRLNPHHIVSVAPRRVIRPNPASQEPDLVPVFEGAVIQLSTGAHHNVIEGEEEVLALMAPFVGPSSAQAHVDLVDDAFSQTQIPELRRDFSDLNLRDDAQDQEFMQQVKAALPPSGDEPPAGTPLTEEELAEVAKHDAIPDEERSPQPGTPAPAKKAPPKKAAPKPPEPKGEDKGDETE